MKEDDDEDEDDSFPNLVLGLGCSGASSKSAPISFNWEGENWARSALKRSFSRRNLVFNVLDCLYLDPVCLLYSSSTLCQLSCL